MTADERFDRSLGVVLRSGVLAAAFVVGCGGVVFLANHGFEQPAYRSFQGEPATLRSFEGIAGQASAMRGRGLIQFGLLILLGTPVARVVFALVGFLRQRDWLYVAITAAVLLILAFSIFGS